MSAWIGFRIKKVEIRGIHHSQPSEVHRVLNESQPIERMSIFLFDLDAVGQRLQDLPWIETIRIERRLPETLILHIQESQPLALWQLEGKFYVIDGRGQRLHVENIEDFGDLPRVVGRNAAPHAPKFLARLENYTLIKQHFTSAVWIGDRRWDIYLDNTLHVFHVLLPETNVSRALTFLCDELNSQTLVTPHNGRLIMDLRLDDRIALRFSSDTP